jgi:hypothetical protein
MTYVCLICIYISFLLFFYWKKKKLRRVTISNEDIYRWEKWQAGAPSICVWQLPIRRSHRSESETKRRMTLALMFFILANTKRKEAKKREVRCHRQKKRIIIIIANRRIASFFLSLSLLTEMKVREVRE